MPNTLAGSIHFRLIEMNPVNSRLDPVWQKQRRRAARTAFRSARISTLREQFMKLGAGIESSAHRIVLHLPVSSIHRRARYHAPTSPRSHA